MRAKASQVLPLARADQLVVRELPDELLVYDLERHKAHCLNKASAIVWKHCDGKMTVAEAARLLERELAVLVEDDVVWLALRQLRRFHLLEEESSAIFEMKVTRRDLMRKYLPAALALPVILSISSPAAAQATSGCGSIGASCGPGAPCCPGLLCNAVTGCFDPR
jgi:sulfur transfer complex TusBCD TusB component (DsrH family)